MDIAVLFVNGVGRITIKACRQIGSCSLFLVRAGKATFTTRLNIQALFSQMNGIGLESLAIVALTGTFTGMVLALQTQVGFQRVGGEQLIGAVVALSMIRELGPVLTGLMVTGRAGSAITAEIGTMRITEQLDALRTLRINIFQYLVIPRILGGTIVVPLLTIFSMVCGTLGGYFMCVHILELSPEDYTNGIAQLVNMRDIMQGLFKAVIFGFILTWIGTYKGCHTNGGTSDVGKATTQSVVTSSISIVIANYFLTKLLESL